MNKKLKRYLEDGDRVEGKIAELQEQLKGIRAAQKMEEDQEIVKSIRSMKLNGRELYSLLCSLQDGSVTFQGDFHFELPQKEVETEKNPAKPEKKENAVSEKVQESEDKGYEKKMEENY